MVESARLWDTLFMFLRYLNYYTITYYLQYIEKIFKNINREIQWMARLDSEFLCVIDFAMISEW